MADLTRRRLTEAVAFAVAALLPAAGRGAVASSTMVVDGVVVYYGLISGEIILGHPQHSPGKDMHGGVPAGAHVYHLIVAVFGAKTSQRVTNAQVSALIEESHEATARKKLEPMPISGEVSYGNFFDLPGAGPYRIAIQIRLPGRPQPIDAVFDFQHART